MDQIEALERLKFLHDQVHQTAERSDHLAERMPLHVHPDSVNYPKDLTRLKGEYNRLVGKAQTDGLITVAELQREGLPPKFDQSK